MPDDQYFSELRPVLNRLLLAIGGLPPAKFDNLAEWDELAPPIIRTAEAVSMALRERFETAASTMAEIAANCAAMRETLKADLDAPPTVERINEAKSNMNAWAVDF